MPCVSHAPHRKATLLDVSCIAPGAGHALDIFSRHAFVRPSLVVIFLFLLRTGRRFIFSPFRVEPHGGTCCHQQERT